MSKQVRKNIGYLGLSQAANYLLPLVTLPYITRVIGPENYGLVEFATVTTLYFSALVTYGFTFTATRKIAELGDNWQRISKVYSTVMQAKLMLLVLSSGLFALLLYLVPDYQEEWALMLFAFPFVVGWGLYPDFLFQGRQKLGVVASANLGIKSLGAVLIFTLIHQEADYILICGINSFTQILAAVITLFYGHKIFPQLQWQWSGFRLIKAYLRSGFYIFASHFLTRIYTFGTILFLGFLLPDKELGLFSAAMKLIVVGQSFLFSPMGGALYPHLAKLAKTDFHAFRQERRKFLLAMMALTASAAALIMLFPEFFVRLVFGEDYLSVAPILALMAPVLVLTSMSHFAMKQGLMVLKADSYNLWVVLITGLASLVLNYGLIKAYGLEGAAWAKLGVEAILALTALAYFQKVWNRRKLLSE